MGNMCTGSWTEGPYLMLAMSDGTVVRKKLLLCAYHYGHDQHTNCHYFFPFHMY